MRERPEGKGSESGGGREKRHRKLKVPGERVEAAVVWGKTLKFSLECLALRPGSALSDPMSLDDT